MRARSRAFGAVLFALAFAVPPMHAATVAQKAATDRAAPEPATDRVIVTLKPAYRGDAALALSTDRVRALAASAGLALRPIRAMSGHAQVLALPLTMRNADVQAVVDRLKRDPAVESAFVDAREQLMAVPNDPLFDQQSYLQIPSTAAPRVSAANAPGAWDITKGTAATVVAIVDGGARFDHPDLAGRLIQGYDFVSADCTPGEAGCVTSQQFTTANDGDGRDGDASDPGDWIPSNKASNPYLSKCDVEPSTWHGTHIAGIVGAAGNNAIGIAGLNWNASLLIVRVSGRCGAYRSDVIDGIRWAVGLSVPSTPTNPRPARIVNISLGSAGSCASSAYAPVISEVLGTGAIIVAAAGNEDGDIILPAACSGVISVGGVRGDGARTVYSNTGSTLTIMAPAGDYYSATNDRILSTNNAGTTTPAAYSSTGYYASLAGTSFSTPIVSGTVSLMLSANPNLTSAQVVDVLRSTARPFVAVAGYSTCVAGGGHNTDNTQPCNCTTDACGAGYVDASAAVTRANALGAGPPAPTPAPTPAPAPTPSSSGGGAGGGGGAIDPLALAILAVVVFATRRLRTTAPPPHR